MLDENFWRKAINGLDIEHDLPTDEELEQQKVLAKDAAVLRISFDMYLITPLGEDEHKAYMVNSNQTMEDCGLMEVREALEMIKKRKKKRRD